MPDLVLDFDFVFQRETSSDGSTKLYINPQVLEILSGMSPSDIKNIRILARKSDNGKIAHEVGRDLFFAVNPEGAIGFLNSVVQERFPDCDFNRNQFLYYSVDDQGNVSRPELQLGDIVFVTTNPVLRGIFDGKCRKANIFCGENYSIPNPEEAKNVHDSNFNAGRVFIFVDIDDTAFNVRGSERSGSTKLNPSVLEFLRNIKSKFDGKIVKFIFLTARPSSVHELDEGYYGSAVRIKQELANNNIMIEKEIYTGNLERPENQQRKIDRISTLLSSPLGQHPGLVFWIDDSRAEIQYASQKIQGGKIAGVPIQIVPVYSVQLLSSEQMGEIKGIFQPARRKAPVGRDALFGSSKQLEREEQKQKQEQEHKASAA